jgi:hypothetical protein
LRRDVVATIAIRCDTVVSVAAVAELSLIGMAFQAGIGKADIVGLIVRSGIYAVALAYSLVAPLLE